MKRMIFKFLIASIVMAMALAPFILKAQNRIVPDWKINPDKQLNPNTKWLREAKWGLFAHYLVHLPSAPIPADMTAEKWNKKVNSFKVKEFADQLTALKVPYFFITIGQGGGYYCSPNNTYENLFGPADGKLSQRDLVGELAKELTSRGIKMCVYLPAVGRGQSPQTQQGWRKVITEWSQRWGKLVSAWWIDGAVFQSPEVYQAYTAAFKSGNPDALVSYNVGPVSMNRQQLVPVTEYEDFLAGECDYFLPTSGAIPKELIQQHVFNELNTRDYYKGPNISGDQLHFLNFLGAWWGMGEPRFSNALVNSWTGQVIDHSGAVTWDVPLRDDGSISKEFCDQIKSLSEYIRRNKN